MFADLAAQIIGGPQKLKPVARPQIKERQSEEESWLNGSEQDIEKYQDYVLDFNIERWIDPLENLTFKTEFVPLTKDDARVLVAEYNRRTGKSDSNNGSKAQELEILRRRLEKAMQSVGNGRGTFVKTSCRSAKDFAHERLEVIYNEKLAGINTTCREADENSKLLALSLASMELLRMCSAEATLDAFCSSERVWHDMQLALNPAHLHRWHEHFAVRQWVDLEPDMEFRLFVCGGCLTALSQYRHLLHFPRLAHMEEWLHAMLCAFFENEVKDKLEGLFRKERYVLDVAVQRETKAGMRQPLCRVIEVNPFFETTDACLFSWSSERHILEGRYKEQQKESEQPSAPVFRIRKRAAKGALSMVYGAWKGFL